MGEYGKVLKDSRVNGDIVNEIKVIGGKRYDGKRGLLYDGWDERKRENWGNKERGW